MKSCNKLGFSSILIYFCCFFPTWWCSSILSQETSLFDELPLNGALQSSSSTDNTNTSQSRNVQHKVNGFKENKVFQQQESSSLFDELPNQGAMLSSSSALKRNTRDSLFTLETSGSLEYDIRPLKPTSDFKNHFMKNTLALPVTNSIATNTGHNVPLVASVPRPVLTPTTLLRPSNTYGTHHHSGSHDHQYFHQRPLSTPQKIHSQPWSHHLVPSLSHSKSKDYFQGRFNRSAQHVSASAGGPTVIVYAHPDGTQTTSPGPKGAGHGSGNLETKNEIHYHYHINEDEQNHQTHRPRPTQTTSNGGGWSKTASRIVSGYPLYRRQANGPFHGSNHHPSPRRHQYGHSPGHPYGSGWRPSGGSGSEGNNMENGGNSGIPESGDVGNAHGSENEGFDDSEESSGSNNNNGSNGKGSGPYPPLVESRLQSKSFNDDSSSSSEEDTVEDFSTRQLFTKRKRQKSAADSISLTYERPPSPDAPVPPPSYGSSSSTYDPPSPTYGPPSHNYGPPKPTYGPPSHNYGPPKPTYGPPSPPAPAGPPAPPAADQPLVAEDKYHTTITLQTIPITRQVTEFVQVPNVVHQITSSSQTSIPSDQSVQADDAGLDPPLSPSSEYGPPAPPAHRTKVRRQPQSKSNKQQKHTAAISGYDAHLSKFIASTGINNDNSATLLGQTRNRLSDLELLELLGSTGRLPSAPILNPGAVGGIGGVGGLGNTLQNGLFSASGTFATAKPGGLGGLGLRQVAPASSGSVEESLREIIREQRYQNILTDLRSRLREESKSADRARSDYRSLFSKGALLLSALTLVPKVVSPFAAAAAGSTSSIANYMLPLIPTAGRRKRSVQFAEKPAAGSRFDEFEKCLSNSVSMEHAYSSTSSSHNQTTLGTEWLHCATTLKIMGTCTVSTTTTNFASLGGRNGEETDTGCLPEEIHLVPGSIMSHIRQELAKYVKVESLVRNSGCLQSELCESLRQVAKIGIEMHRPKLVEVYLNSFGYAGNNPWVQEVVQAFSLNQCDGFLCSRESLDAKSLRLLYTNYKQMY